MCNCNNCANFKEKEKSPFQKWRDKQNQAEMQEKDIWNAAIDAVLELEAPFMMIPRGREDFVEYIKNPQEDIKNLKEE